MIRAGVFIGVNKTGNLQLLSDAAAGAQRMHEWALAQGMPDRTHAKLITDAGGARVNPDLIYDAIKEILDGPGVDQLIVYFAGHGVNINRSEQWLLTEAPVRSNAAVNVAGSVELARYCGVRNVVIISDACRVAPAGIQALNVRGDDIFPNDSAGDRAQPVDQFFACFLGRTAAEISSPEIAAGNYTALYTSVLLDALEGQRTDLLDAPASGEDPGSYVRHRRLEEYLESEVPRRVRELRLQNKVNQNPDAIITSGKGWLARFQNLPARPVTRDTGLPSLPRPMSVAAWTDRLVTAAMGPSPSDLRQEILEAKAGQRAETRGLANATEQVALQFGPDHFESECGIKIRGARLSHFLGPRVQAELLGNEGDLLRINTVNGPAASVLLYLEGNIGTVIPVVPGFIAALSFEGSQLVDVSYEPSANSWRWRHFRDRADEIRSLRAVAAASSLHGRFRLEPESALRVARSMQYAKGIDPTLAVYAAYAYSDLQEIKRIRKMSDFLKDDIGATFFDLALLGRNLLDKSIRRGDDIVPFVPLLAQGWPLLKAHRVRLHPALQGIETSVRDSLWSMYDERGLQMLSAALLSGDIR